MADPRAPACRGPAETKTTAPARVVYIAAFAPDKDESVNTHIAGSPHGGSRPPILPPRDGFVFLDGRIGTNSATPATAERRRQTSAASRAQATIRGGD